ncbi:hypothetical protein [Magnetospira sp. QH-2]|uniref:hypothetical protein n=1 Tax=Magnetospira sp. (strain QH-2) TaxID=1288970 RepID=UPI0003E812F1|nr:hypothetical protein [Magnetospira sp. QH-2]CCQ75759.1 Exported protein of unknown function [Magnetospira sp. QH-2]
MRKPVHYRKKGIGPVWRAILVLVLVLGLARAAFAAMAVVDAQAIKTLGEQLGELRKQVEYLLTIKEKTTGMLDSLGEMGTNDLGLGSEVASQKRRWSAIMGDMNQLARRLQLDKGMSPDFSSVQGAKEFFDKAMRYVAPEKGKGQRAVVINSGTREKIRLRRINTSEDASVEALAAAETATDNYSRHMDDIKKLETALGDEAETIQERLSILGGVMVKLSVLQAEGNLLQAKALKVAGAASIRDLPIHQQMMRYSGE